MLELRGRQPLLCALLSLAAVCFTLPLVQTQGQESACGYVGAAGSYYPLANNGSESGFGWTINNRQTGVAPLSFVTGADAALLTHLTVQMFPFTDNSSTNAYIALALYDSSSMKLVVQTDAVPSISEYLVYGRITAQPFVQTVALQSAIQLAANTTYSYFMAINSNHTLLVPGWTGTPSGAAYYTSGTWSPSFSQTMPALSNWSVDDTAMSMAAIVCSAAQPSSPSPATCSAALGAAVTIGTTTYSSKQSVILDGQRVLVLQNLTVPASLTTTYLQGVSAQFSDPTGAWSTLGFDVVFSLYSLSGQRLGFSQLITALPAYGGNISGALNAAVEIPASSTPTVLTVGLWTDSLFRLVANSSSRAEPGNLGYVYSTYDPAPQQLLGVTSLPGNVAVALLTCGQSSSTPPASASSLSSSSSSSSTGTTPAPPSPYVCEKGIALPGPFWLLVQINVLPPAPTDSQACIQVWNALSDDLYATTGFGVVQFPPLLNSTYQTLDLQLSTSLLLPPLQLYLIMFDALSNSSSSLYLQLLAAGYRVNTELPLFRALEYCANDTLSIDYCNDGRVSPPSPCATAAAPLLSVQPQSLLVGTLVTSFELLVDVSLLPLGYQQLLEAIITQLLHWPASTLLVIGNATATPVLYTTPNPPQAGHSFVTVALNASSAVSAQAAFDALNAGLNAVSSSLQDALNLVGLPPSAPQTLSGPDTLCSDWTVRCSCSATTPLGSGAPSAVSAGSVLVSAAAAAAAYLLLPL